MELPNDTHKIPPTPSPGSSLKSPKENFAKEILRFTLLALIIVVPIRMYIAQPFIVSGASMDPTFKSGQYLIVDQLTYHFDEPQRYDVVIFHYPLDPSTFFIKRVIGLPGETVKSVEGHITVFSDENSEGTAIRDDYIAPNHKTIDTFTKILGPTEYFVMGDNRAESSDSRMWGPLDRKYIVGRPALRLFPFTKLSILPGK